MEPPENRDFHDAALGLARPRNRLLLPESLARTRLVVEAHELGDQVSQVALAEEEDVVEQVPAQGGREPRDSQQAGPYVSFMRRYPVVIIIPACRRELDALPMEYVET